jgi:hypothetical protein
MQDSYKIINNFISIDDRNEIINFIDSIKSNNKDIKDTHVSYIAKKLNGNSYMFDISKNEITESITSFQSGNSVVNIELPNIIHDIIEKICKTLSIEKENIFLQILDMNKGGIIKPHYDFGYEGYITYKCNISIQSDDYEFVVGDDKLKVTERDLYCFEASLYKHYTVDEFSNRRILLSFGFAIPYNKLDRSESDPRVRLSHRIQKYFQKNEK